MSKVREQLKSYSLPNRLKISHLNLEDDNVRTLYIHTIYYLTNLRSANFFIKQMPK